MATKPSVEELFRRLDEQQQAYLRTLREVHEALAQQTPSNSSALGPAGPASTKPGRKRRRSTRDTEAERPTISKAERSTDENGKPLTLGSSVITGDSDESDVEEEFFVQELLPSTSFSQEDLSKHLMEHKFNKHGKKLLESVVDHGRPLHPTLFREYPADELWHNSHYSVFDVGKDGAPFSRSTVVQKGSTIDSAIWQAIQVKIDIALRF